MSNKWQSRLNKLLEENNSSHNTAAALREGGDEFSEIVQTLAPKTPKTHAEGQNYSESARTPTPKTPKTRTDKTKNSLEAERLGLVATWSIEFGYVSIHDPTSGEWHDLPTEDALDWAKREARKRKDLYRAGNRKAFRLTAREMEELWESEQVEMWDHPAVTEKGVVYEDYIEEEE